MEFQTRRLRAGPIDEVHLPALTALLTDDTVKQTYMVPDLASEAEVETLARRLMELSRNPARYMAGIFLEGMLIGIIHDVEIKGDTVELGYALLPAYHNQGYCSEALRGAMDWFFAHGFRKVVTGAFQENRASIRVMEKCGMTRQTDTEDISYRGKIHHCVYYAATWEN